MSPQYMSFDCVKWVNAALNKYLHWQIGLSFMVLILSAVTTQCQLFWKIFFNCFNCFFERKIVRLLKQARTDLEAQSLETSSTSDAVSLITFVQNLKRKNAVWDQLVGVCLLPSKLIIFGTFNYLHEKIEALRRDSD